ncbi:MAG: VOC family protein [Candidatus Binataceae bacterium]
MASVKRIPEGYHSATPFLSVADARKLIDFATRAFGGVETRYHDLGNGHVHAEFRIGDSMFMVGQTEAAPAAIYLYVDDVDTVYARAVAAGAKSVEAPIDKPYGDRGAWVIDQCGITWFIASHIEDVSDHEIAQRMTAQTTARK